MRVDAITLPLCLITLSAAASGCQSETAAPDGSMAQKPAATERSAQPTQAPMARPAPSASANGLMARPGRVK